VATGEGFIEVCQVLIEAGANPNVEDADGNSPLDLACLLEDEETANVLRSLGAKNTSQDF